MPLFSVAKPIRFFEAYQLWRFPRAFRIMVQYAKLDSERRNLMFEAKIQVGFYRHRIFVE
jgi:hypothetical protein